MITLKGWSSVVGILLVLSASAAGAQTLQPPPRVYRGLFGGGAPPDPNRARQELIFGGSVLGGYEDNLTSPGGSEFEARPSGYTGFGDATVRYWYGKEARSVELTGRGYMNTYRNVGLGPAYGADQSFRARTTVGRRTEVQLGESLSYVPFFSLGAFGSLNSARQQNPDASPANGLTDSRFLMTDATAALRHSWTRRSRMDLEYTFNKQTEIDGPGFDTRGQSGLVGFEQSLGRSAGLRASYQRSQRRSEQSGGTVLPLVDHNTLVGFNYQRGVSRTRQVSFAAGVGAMYVDTLNTINLEPLVYWTPSAYGNARFDIGRSWSVAGDYSRSISVLQGLNPQSFVGHVVLVTAGGYIGRRFESVFSTGFSNGSAGTSIDGLAGHFDSYIGTIQLRALLMRGWSSVVSFNHQQYRLNRTATQILGVEPDMHRNAVRVGLVWSLPLFGSYVEAAAASAQRE